MRLFHAGLPSRYETENIVRLFFSGITMQEGVRERRCKEDYCFVRMDAVHVFAGVRDASHTTAALVKLEAGENTEEAAVLLLYRLLCQHTGYTPSWGALTGVRPVSFLRNLQTKFGEDGAREVMTRKFGVSEDKYDLAAHTARVQAPILADTKQNSYSLYVSIPFCPTRCSYCSFVSTATAAEGGLIPAYLEKLHEELAHTAVLAKKLGLQLETVYIGGGTPTSLTAQQLEDLLSVIEESFPLEQAKEYTVEAGRPDTITREKLEVLKAAGVTRISINPQTLNDDVLRRVGRPHTAADFFEKYALAREVGFDNINTDLIAGLPGDTLQGFKDTITGILSIEPENVTVHTLTLKRASNIVIRDEDSAYPDAALMLLENERLLKAGYEPYYMYRQKATLQNLENTGFSKPTFAGLYNVHIMEETQTILSCGAGGSTKLVAPHIGLIERVFNYKYPRDYIQNFAILMEKKQKIEEFYGSHMDTQTLS